MEVDTEEHRIKCYPCDHTHVYYCMRVGYDTLTRKLREMSHPFKDDIKKMRELLKWRGDDVFFRPTFQLEHNGLKAYQCFWDWDTKGVTLPTGCEEPELLADLVQGKRCREFQIDEWLDTWAKRDIYPIWPEEYLSHPGMDEKLFKKLFGRAPTPEIVEGLKVVNTCQEPDGCYTNQALADSV